MNISDKYGSDANYGQEGGQKPSIEEKIKPKRWLILLIVVLGALLTIFYVYNVQSVNDMLSDIRQEEKELRRLKIENERLVSELTELRSADRIIPIAKNKLDMIDPEKPPVIIKKDN